MPGTLTEKQSYIFKNSEGKRVHYQSRAEAAAGHLAATWIKEQNDLEELKDDECADIVHKKGGPMVARPGCLLMAGLSC